MTAPIRSASLFQRCKTLSSGFPFKGNVDLRQLEDCLEQHAGAVPLVLITITNNACGGQPVSLRNLRGVRSLCDRFGVPLYLDACRFAENAWLVKQREKGQRHRPARAIAREMFDLADGCTMSAKKDLLVNIGGFPACRDADLASRVRQRMVVTEGFPTYGGMAGRDLEAVACGLRESLDEDYRVPAREHPLRRRTSRAGIRSSSCRADTRCSRCCAVPGSSASYPAARTGTRGRALPRRRRRACEIGTVMLGRNDALRAMSSSAWRSRGGPTRRAMDYVIEIVAAVWERRAQVVGFETPPRWCCGTGARFRRVGVEGPSRAGVSRDLVESS
jgi:tryptophanase